MPKCYQSYRVRGTWTAPIINEAMRDYCKKRKSLLVPKNKLMSIKTPFDLEHVESRWTGKQWLCASLTVIWSAFIGKYLKSRSCTSLPLARTSPGLSYLWNLKFWSYEKNGIYVLVLQTNERHAKFQNKISLFLAVQWSWNKVKVMTSFWKSNFWHF